VLKVVLKATSESALKGVRMQDLKMFKEDE
jgi:hypothetical protein